MTQSTDAALNAQLLAFFKLFSDADRLEIAGALALRPASSEELATALGAQRGDVQHHLARLSEAGLIVEDANGVFHFQQKHLEELARSVFQALAPARPAFSQDPDVDAFDRKVLADFCDAEGRLKSIPSQYKKSPAVLRYVNKAFQSGMQYSEKQVNEKLSRFHDDYAALRRGLVDAHLLAREHGVYWQVAASSGENL